MIRPRRSVARAAEVEAPDEAGRDRLHELLTVLAEGLHANRAAGDDTALVEDVLRAVLRVAILRLPGQVLPPRQAIFVASADEPAVIGGRRQEEAGRYAEGTETVGGVIEKVDFTEAGLCPTAANVGQQVRVGQITKPDAGGPSPCLFFVTAHPEEGRKRVAQILGARSLQA